MKIIIIGGGLSGLACALSCKQQGLEVTLLEQAPEIVEVRRTLGSSNRKPRRTNDLL